MKPNVSRKNLHSEILDMQFHIWISMKARKCIMKCGSFDNYLLNTNPKRIDSRFGLHIRNLIIQKRKNPDFVIPYISGQASLPKTKVTKSWEYRNTPAIYMPTNVRMSEDACKHVLCRYRSRRQAVLILAGSFHLFTREGQKLLLLAGFHFF